MSNVPQGYKQTEVGVIPEDWKVRPLSNIADIRSGIAKNSNCSVSDPILVHYLRVANVQDGFLDLKEMSKIEVARNDLKRYVVLPGDVLMNEGGDLDKLGRGSIWRGEFNPCVHQNHVFVVRCRSTLFPEYLNIWTGTTPARRYFLVAGKQTTNLATINKTALGQLPVALPSKAEQEAIAGALSDTDGLIESLEQLIAKKRRIKQGAMQELLTGKKRLPGFSGEWEVKRLGNITSLYQPLTIAAHQFVAAGYPVYGANGVVGFYDKFNHELWQVTVTCRGSTCGTVNRTVGKCWITGNAMVVNCEDKKEVDKNFLYYLLSFQDLSICITGTGQPQIVRTPLANYELNVPNDGAEQTAIATILSDMDAEITSLETKLTKTRSLKQGMMHNLLTGRIRLL